MTTSRPKPSLLSRQRRGVSSILIAAMLFTFVVTAALTVDYAYMQLIRTELRAATDAAAKAGAEALQRTEDPAIAQTEAQRYAALNTVAGAPFQIRTNDVQIGRITSSGAGRWQFQLNGNPPNAVQVAGRIAVSAQHKPIPLFFAPALGTSTFSTATSATAGQQEVEICLCLDRSGSMLFDMSGTDYSYPSNNPNLSSFDDWGWTWQNHLSPPHPVHSRWAVLSRAIDLFFTEAQIYTPRPRTSLVTWASDYTMPIAPSTRFKAATTNYGLPSQSGYSWCNNVDDITDRIATLGSQPMMGATNLSAGLDRAVSVLRGTNSNSLNNKVVVLFTDGQWNQGRDPRLAAQDARNARITVHCITVLTADQPDIREVAEITGGRFYRTNNETELRAAFRDIARSLPVVLTD